MHIHSVNVVNILYLTDFGLLFFSFESILPILQIIRITRRMEVVQELKNRIEQLESELKAVKIETGARQKISQMSSEVVDSNPYR